MFKIKWYNYFFIFSIWKVYIPKFSSLLPYLCLKRTKVTTTFNVTLFSIIHIIGNDIILWSRQWLHKIEITVSCVLTWTNCFMFYLWNVISDILVVAHRLGHNWVHIEISHNDCSCWSGINIMHELVYFFFQGIHLQCWWCLYTTYLNWVHIIWTAYTLIYSFKLIRWIFLKLNNFYASYHICSWTMWRAWIDTLNLIISIYTTETMYN